MTESTDRRDKTPFLLRSPEAVPHDVPSQRSNEATSDPSTFETQPTRWISRRTLLERGFTIGVLAAWPAFAWAQHARAESDKHHPTSALPSRKQLTESEFAYVSPLLANGSESTCHGEVWYAWLDESVVLITAKSTWKARALARGLDSARVWIGDHGRWKGWFRNNEAFRQAPNFEAIATIDNDVTLLDRLMNVYETKYPEEFSQWEDRQRSGFQSGERIIVRYSTV